MHHTNTHAVIWQLSNRDICNDKYRELESDFIFLSLLDIYFSFGFLLKHVAWSWLLIWFKLYGYLMFNCGKQFFGLPVAFCDKNHKFHVQHTTFAWASTTTDSATFVVCIRSIKCAYFLSVCVQFRIWQPLKYHETGNWFWFFNSKCIQ